MWKCEEPNVGTPILKAMMIVFDRWFRSYEHWLFFQITPTGFHVSIGPLYLTTISNSNPEHLTHSSVLAYRHTYRQNAQKITKLKH